MQLYLTHATCGANCERTLTIHEKLDRWLGDTKRAVIHFNAGLHDLAYVEAENAAPGQQVMVPGRLLAPCHLNLRDPQGPFTSA
jgi:hypothetical protein